MLSVVLSWRKSPGGGGEGCKRARDGGDGVDSIEGDRDLCLLS